MENRMNKMNRNPLSLNEFTYDFSGFERTVHEGVPLINITKLAKTNKTSKTKTHNAYQPTKYAPVEYTNPSHSAKYVDYLWAVKFLSSRDNVQQEEFLQWVAVCLFQQLEYGSCQPITISENNSSTSTIDDSNNIDVHSSFGLSCSNCGHSHITGKSISKKRIWSLTDSTYRNSKVMAYMNTIQQMFSVSGVIMIEVLALYFQNFLAHFLALLSYVVLKPGSEIERVVSRYITIRQNFFAQIPDVRNAKEDILLLKDFMLLSDERYQHFVDYVQLKGFLPCSETLYRCRKEINTAITQKYEIQYNGVRLNCNFLKVLQDMLIIHRNECERANVNPQIGVLELKMVIDKGANSFLIGAVGPLNLILSPQSRHSYVSCVALDDEESKENSTSIFKYMVEILNASIMILHPFIFDVAQQLPLPIIVYLTNDLKMVGLVTDLNDDDCFCPYCKCKKHERHLFEKECEYRCLKYHTNPKFNIATLPCSLHLKIRVVCNLMLQVFLKQKSFTICKTIQQRISELPHCSQFKYRNTQVEDDDNDDVVGARSDQFLPDLPYLNGPNSLKGNVEEYFKLKLYCKWLGMLLIDTYPTSKFAYYIHILVKHVASLIFMHGPLIRFANQGSENIHAGHILGVERATAAGGRAKEDNKKTPMEQVVFQEFRRIYLTAQRDIPWQSKLNDTVYVTSWKSVSNEYEILQRLELAQGDAWKSVLRLMIGVTDENNIQSTERWSQQSCNFFENEF
ncbi:hypothetical protein C9374_000190 [Naegleria lovaniensis]|uniref:Uncharacterized protein n=1 Tax=Naegleria lovaniensis TaxID=51637 RepID=A0AA88KPM1_NAELO|nr:uncharacterized protein C9374_000190 [Naegleria lovaniensis]KAG2388751.1 hypothetical protein C9374_000190 [Naegleria lovaniensis]